MSERSVTREPRQREEIALDLDDAAPRLCHTIGRDGRTMCGMGRGNTTPEHDWIEPVDGICPTCGKRSCPTCDVLEGIDWWRSDASE